jgi:hypothetical protein
MQRRSGIFGVLAAVLFVGPAAAAPAKSAGSAGAPPNPHGAAELPPGHPAITDSEPDDDDTRDEELPPGHPAPSGSTASAGPQVHLPEDQSTTDDTLPAGVIVVETLDASEHPVPRANVTLGILQQSVAKGESRKRVSRQADEAGVVRFDGLETGGGVAYRVTVPWGDTEEQATYAAMPFQLDLHHGQHVRLHVYPVTHNVAEARLGMGGLVYIELKDDAIQLEELFQVYNLSLVTWVPHGVVVPLPRGFKAFNAQREMSDTGFDEVPGTGAKLRGTFGPGRHDVHFRYQLPYEGDESIDFTLGLPPQVAQMEVIAEASKSMTLHADGFPTAVPNRNQRGQRVLVTQRAVRGGESPLARVRVSLDNIPTEGSAKWIATGLAAATIAFGIYLATQQAREGQKQLDLHDSERARTRLVAEVAALERARRAGEVGPSAYARIHAALVDSLARLLPMEPLSSEYGEKGG